MAIVYYFKNMVLYSVIYQALDHGNGSIRLLDFSQTCSNKAVNLSFLSMDIPSSPSYSVYVYREPKYREPNRVNRKATETMFLCKKKIGPKENK